MSLEWMTVVAGMISALSWLASALVTPNFSLSYFDEAPKHIRRRAAFGTWLNASGAFFAAIAIGAQAYGSYIAMN